MEPVTVKNAEDPVIVRTVAEAVMSALVTGFQMPPALSVTGLVTARLVRTTRVQPRV